MAKAKKMNEGTFGQILKEYHAIGELVRARQDEKQAILDQFDSESKRFFFGKISVKSLESSIRKTNKELNRLDREIRSAISKANMLGKRMHSLVSAQVPTPYNATMSGISRSDGKKKKGHKKKVRKVAKKAKKSVKKTKKRR